jgi:glycosyltransferase involved in cell wall biosynthesis
MSHEPARILLVEMNEDGTVGGSHQALYDLVRLVDRRRFTPVVSFYQDNRFAGALQGEGVEVHILEAMRREELQTRFHGGRVQRAADILAGAILRRRRFLRQHRIDLVHLNNSPGSGNDDWLPAARMAGTPCVTFAMGNAPRGMDPVHASLARRFDRILVISEQVRRSFLASGFPEGLLSLTQIGVDLECFRGRKTRDRATVRKELGIDPERVVACMVGNIRQWKGQHVVVEALARLAPSVRDRLLVLFVGAVGPTFAAYAQQLEEEIRRLGVGESVRFLGGRTDVPDLLGASDLGLHGSVLPEPFGLVVVEAMAMGLPVVATSIGAPGEVVTREVGRTFDPADPAALARVLTELVEDAELRRSLGAGAARRADLYDARAMVRAVEQVYGELLSDRPHRE